MIGSITFVRAARSLARIFASPACTGGGPPIFEDVGDTKTEGDQRAQ
jgi:hypothetical protein